MFCYRPSSSTPSLTNRSPFGALSLLLPAALILYALAAAGCESLLEVEPNPDTVPGEQIDNPTSLEARLVGVEADFFFAYDMAVIFGGLFTDELIDATGLDEIDERRVQSDNGTIGAADENPEGIDGLWTPMQRATAMADLMQEDILEDNFPEQIPNPENSAELARVSLFAGYSKLMLADLFCSLAFGGTGPELTPQETYELAIEEFTTAIEAGEVATDVRYAALVGRARAQLQLGNDQAALSDAQQVPIDFEFIADAYSSNSQREENDIWNMLSDSERFSVAPAYRDLTIDDTSVEDPRLDVFQDPDNPFAIDGSTPLYQVQKYISATSPLRLASGLQAQYIIAEIQGGEEAVDLINAVRDLQGIDVEYDPASLSEVRQKVLEERSRTLFLEGQRMGDLRRFLDRHNVNLFPTGANFGDQTCFPLPDVERENNPGLQ